MAGRTLLVDADASALTLLQCILGGVTQVDACTSFLDARRRLHCDRYDRLVTNLRLQAYNGLHLVYLAPSRTRSIVYTDRHDTGLGRDVQDAGAFYESRERLRHALAGYLQNQLPATDRRALGQTDRRGLFRGGRRRSDVPRATVDDQPTTRTTA